MPSDKKRMLFETIWGFTNAQTRTEQGRAYEYNILTLSLIILFLRYESKNEMSPYVFYGFG